MKRKRLVAIVCGLLALLLIAGLVMSAVGSLGAQAATSSQLKDKLKDLKTKQSELNERQKEVRSQIQALTGQINEVSERKKLLDMQIDLTEQEIDVVTAQIEVVQQEIVDKEVEYVGVLDDEQHQLVMFRDRVREMEESGQISYYAILFNARSITDLLSRIDFISEIMHYDEGVVDRLHDAQSRSDSKRLELIDIQTEAESYQGLLIEKKAEREAQSVEAENLIKELQSGKEEYEAINEQLEAEREALDDNIESVVKEITEIARREAEERRKAEAARIAAEKAAREANRTPPPAQSQKPLSSSEKIDSIQSSGTYTWPVPGVYTITDTFRIREVHPVTGKTNVAHTGIDIGAKSGTKVVAADSGQVVRSEYNSSYGNYIQIAHGNGRFTAYGHLSKRSVSVGDKVTKGQQIGLVGSTGISTGPHLHFETYSNGVRVNPQNYNYS